MFKRSDFNNLPTQALLSNLKGKYQYTENMSSDTVAEILDKLKTSILQKGVGIEYVLKRLIYEDTKGNFAHVRITLRPTSRYALEIDTLKKSIVLFPEADLFDKFIDEMIAWFDSYIYHTMMQENIQEFNAELAKVVKEGNIPFSIKVNCGSGILDVGVDYVEVGIKHEEIINMAANPIFDDKLPMRQEGYVETIIASLRECSSPHEIVKVQSPFTKTLGIYSRRSYITLLRQIVSRNVTNVRTGIGYYLKDNVFAIIEKTPLTVTEASTFDGYLLENTDASLQEKKRAATKIGVTYKVNPFHKDTYEPVELALSEII